jgi:signal transduction histidine kinase
LLDAYSNAVTYAVGQVSAAVIKIEVEIGENGPGIPPEIKPHIFDPFFTTKGVGEGAGLGLNTVRTIVRKHGGNVQMESVP